MKLIKIIFIGMFFFTLGCKDGYIDDIKAVQSESDLTAPVVNINYPKGEIVIPFTEEDTDLNFEFEVFDDIEIESVTITLQGNALNWVNASKDYRRFTGSYLYKDLPVGEYIMHVTAKDITGKTTTEELAFVVTNKYVSKYANEIFYMPFEGNIFMELISEKEATVVGAPGFSSTAAVGEVSYAGAQDSYLTFPTEGLLGNEFSAAFWYNVNATPDRAGILVIGPPDPANPNTPNNRKNGFRFLREANATSQTFKLNVGNGEADSWFDGGTAASLNPSTAGWKHIAFTISDTEAAVYIDGKVVSKGSFSGIDWTGTDILSIGSGAPRFTEWNHLSDRSFIDELRLFNKALTPEEVLAVMNDGL